MVAYELSLLIRVMPRPKLADAVKRTAQNIISNGGYIEKIEYIGTKELNRRIGAHGKSYTKGSFFVLQYHIPLHAIDDIKDFSRRDLDIIRPVHIVREIPEEIKCLLDEETKPPAYRSEVELMMKEAQERLPRGVRMKQKMKEELKDDPF